MIAPTHTSPIRSTLCKGISAVLLLAWIGGGCAMLSPSEPEIEMEEMSFSFDTGENPSDRFSRYLIAPGDVLDVLYHVKGWEGQTEFKIAVDHQVSVKFPSMPELNELAVVRPDGNISLPYLGEISVIGMTVSNLTIELKERYTPILRDPELFVTVPDFRQAIREFKDDLHTAPRGLSRLVTVRPDGQATFAMIGDIMVSGKTIKSVQDAMNARYSEIMPGLSADLFLEHHSGSRIYILGQVGEPGSYEIQRPTTVIEALAIAGSPLRTAKLASVVIIRRRGDRMVGMRVDARSALHLRKNSLFFYLQPDDVVFVPRTTISKIGDIAQDVQRILFFNGWGFSIEFDPFAKDLVPVSTTVTTESKSFTEGSGSESDGGGGTGSTSSDTSETQSSTTETRDTHYKRK